MNAAGEKLVLIAFCLFILSVFSLFWAKHWLIHARDIADLPVSAEHSFAAGIRSLHISLGSLILGVMCMGGMLWQER